MREIKFRSVFFDYKEDKFSHFGYWGFINHKNEYNQRCFISPGTSGKQYRKFENQYTGLKGWYQGDLIRDERTGVIFEIVWNYEYMGWWCVSKDKTIEHPLNELKKYCKAIGHIYENPELINQTK